MRQRRLLQFFVSLGLSIVVLGWTLFVPASAFTARNLVYGSQGYDVYELQNRLKYTGFYNGKVDGRFGWGTYWAVRNFQYKFGVPVTGVVNFATKSHLVNSSPGWHYQASNSSGSASGSGSSGSSASASTSTATPKAATTAAPVSAGPNVVSGISSNDVNIMAHVVYGEARGEPMAGQIAIAAVILNRLRDPKFPHTVAGIVYQDGAFDATMNGQANLQPNSSALTAVEDALHGMDPSQGAIYYYNPATATSSWIWSRPIITRIGHHVFCR